MMAASTQNGSGPVETPGDLGAAVASFCRFLREEDYNIGIRETLDAMRLAREGMFLQRRPFFQSMRTLLCTTSAEWRRFEGLFDRFWLEQRGEEIQTRRRRNRPFVEEKKTAPLLMIAAGKSGEVEPGKTTSGAHAAERLRKTDFSAVPVTDQKKLEDLVLRLCRRLRLNLSCRTKPDTRRGRIDLKRTIRKNLGRGGQPLHLAYRARRERKNRLVALLDVSGSMDAYSYFLLLFIFAMRREFERVDVYVFSTRLNCVNEALRTRRLKEAVRAAGDLAEAWSSGTQIGACLRAFNQGDGRRLLTGRTLLFILSDGLDTGDPEVLARALAQMKRRVKRVIWLNPLKGAPGYEPLARGMKRALPYIDVFAAANNLDSLLDLESHLAHV